MAAHDAPSAYEHPHAPEAPDGPLTPLPAKSLSLRLQHHLEEVALIAARVQQIGAAEEANPNYEDIMPDLIDFHRLQQQPDLKRLLDGMMAYKDQYSNQLAKLIDQLKIYNIRKASPYVRAEMPEIDWEKRIGEAFLTNRQKRRQAAVAAAATAAELDDRIKRERADNEDAVNLARRYSRACFICANPNPLRRAALVKCGHLLCSPCAQQVIRTSSSKEQAQGLKPRLNCPFCKASTTFVRLFEEEEDERDESESSSERDDDDAVENVNDDVVRETPVNNNDAP